MKKNLFVRAALLSVVAASLGGCFDDHKHGRQQSASRAAPAYPSKQACMATMGSQEFCQQFRSAQEKADDDAAQAEADRKKAVADAAQAAKDEAARRESRAAQAAKDEAARRAAQVTAQLSREEAVETVQTGLKATAQADSDARYARGGKAAADWDAARAAVRAAADAARAQAAAGAQVRPVAETPTASLPPVVSSAPRSLEDTSSGQALGAAESKQANWWDAWWGGTNALARGPVRSAFDQ
jgi:colicin import membrane protein